MRRRTRVFQGIALFLSVMGPGIITAMVDNDAGGITTYSMAGAAYGYGFLWTMLPMTVALVVVQEMCARMGAVTGKGLADLIRENFGVKITIWVLFGLLLGNIGNTATEFAGLAASMEIWHTSKYISVPIGAVLVWMLVVRGTYASVEKMFLLLSFFYFTYCFSGLMAHPDWSAVGHNMLWPTAGFKWDADYIAMFVGLVGTTIAPWMQFYIQSSIVEKGVTAREYALSRIDVIIGCIGTDVVASFIVIACGATLFVHGVKIDTAKDAALSLRPLAGDFAANLFAFGLLNASVFSATILPLATSYYICEALGWEAGVNKQWEEAPHFYVLYTLILSLGAALILIPGAPLMQIMFWTQVVNGALLPFVLVFMILLINNRRLMGEYVNGPIYNAIAWFTTIVMILFTIALLVTQIKQLLGV